MSNLEELIQEYCPNGVEYVKIKDVFTRLKGTSITAGKMKEIETSNGEIKIFAGGKTVINANECDIPNANITRVPAVLVQSRGVIDFIYYDQPFTFKNEMWAYTAKNIITVKYLYYVLKNNVQYFRESASGMGALPQISLGVTEDFIVPLPALPVQREIVRILDSFTLYSAELTAELTARRKQYEFYRDKLLTFEKTEVKQMPLGKLAKFTYGYTDVAKDVGDARFIRITDINEDGCLSSGNCKYITLNDESKKYLLKEGDLLLARTGATYGKTLYFPNNEPAVYASFLIKIDLDNSVILNRYYWHFSKSNLYWKQADKYVSKAGQQQFNTNAVSRVIVPVPSIEVQERIVKVLDNFDEICSDLKIGLPAEMEKRQQQYEYYRDKLLTFDTKSATIFRQTDRQTDRAD